MAIRAASDGCARRREALALRRSTRRSGTSRQRLRRASVRRKWSRLCCPHRRLSRAESVARSAASRVGPSWGPDPGFVGKMQRFLFRNELARQRRAGGPSGYPAKLARSRFFGSRRRWEAASSSPWLSSWLASSGSAPRRGALAVDPAVRIRTLAVWSEGGLARTSCPSGRARPARR